MSTFADSDGAPQFLFGLQQENGLTHQSMDANGNKMSPYIPYTSPGSTSSLELIDVEHIGEITKGTMFQKLTGNVPSGPVLKDVSLEVYGGEVMGILGSSGSGKRALLDVISRRAMGTTRGLILLNQMPITAKMFQDICAVVTLKNDLIPGLTLGQSLNFAAALTVSSMLDAKQRNNRVRQIMDDMNLMNSSLLAKESKTLDLGEKRRLLIAMELVRDPLMILIDEPTRDLDPINSYLIMSLLASYAKKYNRMVIITMEKPRSDLAPLLDRVTILSLGDVVYTGYTRGIADYFKQIGFPCPDMENPLMYYLCLATVDRRSKERFTETNNHIEILVQQYKFQGEPFKRYTAPSGADSKSSYPPVLAALPKPTAASSLITLVNRKFTHFFNFFCHPKSISCWEPVILRTFAFPLLCFFFWLFYFRIPSQSQYSFVSRNGLIFNALALVTFLSASATVFTFDPFRTRYFQETRCGSYSGQTFILSEAIHSAIVNLLTIFCGSAILFYGCGLQDDLQGSKFIMFVFVLYCCWNFVELQTNCLMMCIKEPLEALSTTLFIAIFYLVCASGTVKSINNLDDWLYFLTYGMIYRYAGSVLNYNEFHVTNATVLDLFGRRNFPCGGTVDPELHCRYLNSTDFLLQRYTRPVAPTTLVIDVNRDFGLCWVFYLGMILVTTLIYSVPLPLFLKRKFRD